MVEQRGYSPEFEDVEMAEEDVEQETPAEDAIEDAKELAEEIVELVAHPNQENRYALKRIASILAEPMSRLRKFFSRESVGASESAREIPDAVKAKMVHLDQSATELDLRDAVASLLRELRGLTPPEATSAQRVAELLGKDVLDARDAGYVHKKLGEAIDRFQPTENDPTRIALYDQLRRFSRALWEYHLSERNKTTKPFTQESPADFAVGLMDLGVDPGKAVKHAAKDQASYERARKEHREQHSVVDSAAKMRDAFEALDPELDFVQTEKRSEESSAERAA